MLTAWCVTIILFAWMMYFAWRTTRAIDAHREFMRKNEEPTLEEVQPYYNAVWRSYALCFATGSGSAFVAWWFQL